MVGVAVPELTAVVGRLQGGPPGALAAVTVVPGAGRRLKHSAASVPDTRRRGHSTQTDNQQT